MKQVLALFFCMHCLFASVSLGDVLEKGAAVSGSITPGSSVSIKGDFSSTTNLVVTLSLVHGTASTPLNYELVADKKALSAKLPSSMDPGAYYLSLREGESTVNVPGTITIQRDAAKLTSVHPATQYREASDQFNFDLIGENFSTKADENDVWIDGQGSILSSNGTKTECLGDPTNKTPAKTPPCLWVENASKMHVVGYKAEAYQGPVLVSVRVGNGVFTDKHQLLLARRSEAEILLWSGVATLVLFLAVAGIVRSGSETTRPAIAR